MFAYTFLLMALAQVPADSGVPLKEAWESAAPADDLKQLQGAWEISQSDVTVGAQGLPKETGLSERGALLIIRGNELLIDGRTVATLANDLSALGLPWEQSVKPFRRPLLMTLPDGRAVLCAYDRRHLSRPNIVYPASIGNVGAGHFVYLKRPAPIAEPAPNH